MMGQARCVCCADDRVLFFVFVIDIFAHKSVENQPEAAIIYRFTFLKTRRRHCVDNIDTVLDRIIFDA